VLVQIEEKKSRNVVGGSNGILGLNFKTRKLGYSTPLQGLRSPRYFDSYPMYVDQIKFAL
jgi:hypothetical protein